MDVVALIFAAIGGLASLVAVVVGVRALGVSVRTQKDAAREHERADARQRLMYLQTY